MWMKSGLGSGFQGSDDMKKKARLKKKKVDNMGNSMVETLVAFTVLLIILALLYQMIAFCSTLRMKATDMENVMKTFNTELYRTGEFPADGPVRKYTYSSLSVSDGPVLYFSVDRNMTDTSLNGVAQSEGVTTVNERNRLKFTDISLECFAYNPDDEVIKNGNLIAPKAIMFVHKKENN